MTRETEHISKCRSCGADIVFLRTASKSLMPVDADKVNRDDYYFDRARHVSHFSTCPDADKFRKRK